MYFFKKITFVVILFLSHMTYGQINTSSKEKLEKIMHSEIHDTIKMQSLYFYIEEVQPNNHEEAQKYTEVFYQLVKKTGYKKGLGFYYFLCAIDNRHRRNHLECYNYALKSAEVFKEINELQDYLVAMQIACSSNVYLKNYDSAYKMAEEALEYTKKTDLQLQKAYLYKCMADCKSAVKDYDAAIKLYGEASNISNQLNDFDLIVAINMAIADKYSFIGHYKESLEYLIKAEGIVKKNGYFFHDNVYALILSKAIAYYNLKDYSAAKNEFMIAVNVPVSKEKKEYLDIRMALVDFYLGKKEESFLKAYSLLKEVSDPYIIAYCNYCKALYLTEYGRTDEAITSLKETIRILNLKKDKNYEEFKVLADANKILGKLSVSEGDKKKGDILLKEASTLEKRKEQLKENFELNKLALTSDLREKNWEVKRLSNQNAENNKNFKKQYSKTLLLSGILLFFLSGVGYIFIRGQKKRNKELANKNTLINLKKAEIEQKLAEKALLVKEIHHRVKNNFQLVISLLYLQVESEDIKNIQEFLDEVTSRMLSMAIIHQSLYITENSESINFKDYIKELTAHFEKVATNSSNLLSFNVEMPEVMIDVHKAITLGLIVNEMILNSVKHVQLKNEYTEIYINLQLYDGKYLLIYKDNGSVSNVSKDSFGTELIHLLVKQIKGELTTSTVNGYCYSIKFNVY